MLYKAGMVEILSLFHSEQVRDLRWKKGTGTLAADHARRHGCVPFGNLSCRHLIEPRQRVGFYPRRAEEGTLERPGSFRCKVTHREDAGILEGEISLRALDDRSVGQHTSVAHRARDRAQLDLAPLPDNVAKVRHCAVFRRSRACLL